MQQPFLNMKDSDTSNIMKDSFGSIKFPTGNDNFKDLHNLMNSSGGI